MIAFDWVASEVRKKQKHASVGIAEFQRKRYFQEEMLPLPAVEPHVEELLSVPAAMLPKGPLQSVQVSGSRQVTTALAQHKGLTVSTRARLPCVDIRARVKGGPHFCNLLAHLQSPGGQLPEIHGWGFGKEIKDTLI
ncbi:hypothetical protein J1605_011625 [Eschrichtius robustus]|uniref:Uncharacterized protein n=1 Tax=Eschrichtius robustus TaxID=9764 RepID=A0AB34GL95_ESCRO|nr:hypothetical protein J1605_011625 [Eschrichtius robustus]